MNPRHVLFVQKSAHKAGAQSCLERVLRQLGREALDPILLVSEEGWLTAECRRNGLKVIRLPFPSSRSLAGRLYKIRSFGRQVEQELQRAGWQPPIVQGNDHPEALLTLELSRRLQAKSSVILRTSAMARRDYFKYRCGRADLLIGVSETLKEAVEVWDPGKQITVIPDGLCDEEFLPPKEPPAGAPGKILVLGNSTAGKGWRDLMAALEALKQERELPSLELDFTDQRPRWMRSSSPGESPGLNFIGRHDDFCALVRRYDLVLNPSRTESFGMAALEVVAAGVPLLTSRSGVIEKIIQDTRFLFEPNNPRSLATALRDLLRNWPASEIDSAAAQRRLRERFHIGRSVHSLLEQYRTLVNG
ncbi:MAG TPA: glycosyltransferase family 4 protein [Candidatus Binatia bacterium]